MDLFEDVYFRIVLMAMNWRQLCRLSLGKGDRFNVEVNHRYYRASRSNGLDLGSNKDPKHMKLFKLILKLSKINK